MVVALCVLAGIQAGGQRVLHFTLRLQGWEVVVGVVVEWRLGPALPSPGCGMEVGAYQR